MPLETHAFDVVDFLRDDEDIAGYLSEMLEADSLALTERAVGEVERAKSLPADSSLDLAGRLYRAARSVGLRLTAVPAAPRAA
ncbi:hypothetical protein HZ989_01065 [Brevundimonas sp. AJA228-03]|uniref:hypothetical protein n=1 Tax=Brevundimonas sp. AJA228-03 TaxID=2752515 RepID=UPI001ADFDE28|nr:hypothetical protein [Brevundimonas sp. AJA228-03]QTN19704.1 hypothetical protein HZ989_01065 [Brevundimonas sp. AJA228-03]